MVDEVAGGEFNRTYVNYPEDEDDAGVTFDDGGMDLSEPATVTQFGFDEYVVTVGRFRQFVDALYPGSMDAGVAWTPEPGSGTHAYLNSGQGLANSGSPGTYEPGWLASDDVNIAPTDTNLTTGCSNGTYATWTPSAAGGHENLPINCTTWAEAYAFCIWDGGFLPSEAEWEFAAAGGGQQREYPWGFAGPSTFEYAIYDCQYPSESYTCPNVGSIAPVGTATLGAARWGQLDLGGEVEEWTLDWYASIYFEPCVDCGYYSPASDRVVRGASFEQGQNGLQPWIREEQSPTTRSPDVGFRCARAP